MIRGEPPIGRNIEEEKIAALSNKIAAGRLLVKPLEHLANITQAETGHWLLELKPEKLANLQHIDSIVIVGPSAAGKSTFGDAARVLVKSEEGMSGPFIVPKRIVSRPQRAGDNLEENDF